MIQNAQLSQFATKIYDKPVARVSLELLLSFGAVLSLGALIIQPTLVKMSELIKEKEEKTAFNQKLDTKIGALAVAQTEYAAVRDQVYLLDESIPSQPEVVKNLKIIERTASDTKVVITSMTLSAIPSDSKKEFTELTKKTLPVSVSVTGDYVSIRTFLQNLHNNRRSFDIESVTFATDKNKEDLSLNSIIVINVPFYGEAQ